MVTSIDLYWAYFVTCIVIETANSIKKSEEGIQKRGDS